MKKLLSAYIAVLLTITLPAQTYLPISNNMVIGSNANIKFAAGNYIFSDAPADGVIQINGVQNIVLDGDSCRVDGIGSAGYMIKINNAHNVVIKNFDSVFHYKYAVYITNSDHITINGNVFCWNKADSSGWIDVWADYTLALGGGVMMYQSRAVNIINNTMTMQNDGVAMYHCDSVSLHNNNFSWNTSYGIRMFWTDSCHIYQNNCTHVNRPLTDPSDCGAILLIVSNNNSVENNDFSYSGDGIFLGQYQHSNIPNNNYFAWNECSYSPHNAIEATFADGNVYKHNSCKYSAYGFWLGYSFNSVVDSNDILGNYQDGIAIDRGFSNTISNNLIRDNPIGIELWEGSPATGYTTYHSQDYPVLQNIFEGNIRAISSTNTKHAIITGNQFNYSEYASIYFDGTSLTDTITGNTFRMPTAYHMYNNSVYAKYAPGNLFIPSDSLLTSKKIYDKGENASKGEVTRIPALPGPPAMIQANSPCDMAEPSAVWYGYPETGYPAAIKIPDTVYFDTIEKKTGAASVKLVTSRGWEVALNYRPERDSLAEWHLTDNDTLWFWVRTIKQPQYGFQYFTIRVGDDHGNYYKYTASPSLLNAANLSLKQYRFPLAGNAQFTRSMTGTMSLDQVNYLEFRPDTWDYGFTMWVDGVQFHPCTPVTSTGPNPSAVSATLANYPNPFPGTTTISYTLEQAGHVKLEVYDFHGTKIRTLADGFQLLGDHEIVWDAWIHRGITQKGTTGSELPDGIYLLKMTTSSGVITRKMLLIR